MSPFVGWLSAHMLPCAYKQLLGISCPMCGAQRALLLLLQGRCWEACRSFPPLVVWALTALVCLLAWKRLGSRGRWWLVAVNLAALLFNAFYQNLLIPSLP